MGLFPKAGLFIGIHFRLKIDSERRARPLSATSSRRSTPMAAARWVRSWPTLRGRPHHRDRLGRDDGRRRRGSPGGLV